MFLQPGPHDTFSTWGNVYFDFLDLQGSSGQDCVLQLYDNGTIHAMHAHSASGSVSQVGVNIPVTAGVTYWMTLQYDSNGGTCTAAVFDPVTFVQIGVTSVVPLDRNVNNEYVIIESNGHHVTTNAHTFFDNVVVDWTAGNFPLVPR
jgi:hypothetical protein